METTPRQPAFCPSCGARVLTIFDHLDLDCTSDEPGPDTREAPPPEPVADPPWRSLGQATLRDDGGLTWRKPDGTVHEIDPAVPFPAQGFRAMITFQTSDDIRRTIEEITEAAAAQRRPAWPLVLVINGERRAARMTGPTTFELRRLSRRERKLAARARRAAAHRHIIAARKTQRSAGARAADAKRQAVAAARTERRALRFARRARRSKAHARNDAMLREVFDRLAADAHRGPHHPTDLLVVAGAERLTDADIDQAVARTARIRGVDAVVMVQLPGRFEPVRFDTVVGVDPAAPGGEVTSVFDVAMKDGHRVLTEYPTPFASDADVAAALVGVRVPDYITGAAPAEDETEHDPQSFAPKFERVTDFRSPFMHRDTKPENED